MEIVLSAFIGALSAIAVALINQKKDIKKKEEAITQLVKELNIGQGNVYIYDHKKPDSAYKFETNASSGKTLIILK